MDDNTRRNTTGPFNLTLVFSYIYIIEEWEKYHCEDVLIKTPFGYLDKYEMDKLSRYGFDLSIKDQNERGTTYIVNNYSRLHSGN
mgnify:CR=1 FL=1